MQAWPWLWKIANAEPLTAASRSASAKTMLAPLPPSSSWTRLRLPAEAWTISPPHRRRAGEGDLAHVRMRSEMGAARPARPGDDVHHPGREPDLGHQLGRPAAPLSGVSSAGLSTTVLPAASAGPIFQLQNISGKFQGTIWPTDAERLAQDVVQEARLDRDDVALELVGHAAEVAERGRGPGTSRVAAVADRVAGVEALEPGQLVGLLLDPVGQPEQQATPSRRLHPRPGRERVGCGRDGSIDILGTGLGDVGQDRTVVRVERLESRRRRRRRRTGRR